MKTDAYQWDQTGLPLYSYLGAYPASALDQIGRDALLPPDPCFILGNYRLTAFTHVSGQIELLTGERGWMRLNHRPGNGYWNRASVTVARQGQTAHISLAGETPFAHRDACFGAGYARYRDEGAGVAVERIVRALPSEEINQGVPGLLFEVNIKNQNTEPVQVSFREDFLVSACMLSYQQDQAGNDPVARYENTLTARENTAEARISCRFLKTMLPAKHPTNRHPYDCFPPAVFMRAGENASVCAQRQQEGDWLSAECKKALKPGETLHLSYILGLYFPEKETLQDCAAPLLREKEFAAAWKRSLPDFQGETDPALRWEMIWNAYVLSCMATYHQYFDETYLPQGSVYAYRLGQNTSQRDHLQHLLPEIRLRPALAKSCLRFVLKHMEEDGRIIRQDVGYGYEDQDVYWESDPQLYLFMAAGMYLRETNDWDFLRETVAFYPVENGKAQTVLDALKRAFIYLRDVVRCGRHGLVMMRNSDWSDSFFHPYSPNVYAQAAESHMNSAMALAVLPPFMEAIEKAGNEEAIPWVQEMKAWRQKLFDAFMADLGDRPYAPRCYIGFDDDPALRFGEDRLCIEAQIWLLLTPDFPLERKQKLYALVKKHLIAPEKLGARTRERPLWPHDEGASEDGGMWYAHQGVLLWALSRFALEEGRALLRRLTFHHFAESYPRYWVGQWSAPDSFESSLSRREGLYSAWVDHPFIPFCAHAHAWMLYGYLLLSGSTEFHENT